MNKNDKEKLTLEEQTQEKNNSKTIKVENNIDENVGEGTKNLKTDDNSAKKGKSKSKKEKGIKFYKKPGFRYSMLATVLSIVFIVVIVAVNILASMLDARFTALQLDMTTSQDYSISDENTEYIQKLDKEVTVTVAATEDYYISTYNSFLSNNYYYNDPTGGKYFNQTVQLLNKYPKINDKISVQFLDPTTPAFDDFSEKYNNQYTYGSVIVECTFTNSAGKEQSRSKILQVEDLYETNAESSATSYSETTITGSKVEQALTSALYYVSTEQQDKAAFITGYGCDDASDLESLLSDNNYDTVEIDSLTTSDIPDDVKLLVIAAPTYDFTSSEIKKLDNYMLGHEDYGRNILYVGSPIQTALPNLDKFLDEWGITFATGTLFETNENYRSPNDSSFMVVQDGGSQYTTDNTNAQYLCSQMRPMTLKFEQSSSYYTYSIVKSFESTTIMPRGAKDSWEPATDAVKQEYPVMALSVYAAGTDDDDNILSSNILAIASLDFYSTSYTSTYGTSNQSTLLSMVNNIVGRQEDVYSVTSKVISSQTFEVTETQSNIVMYLVVIIVPIVTLIFGIIVVIRRKRK